MTKRGAEGAFDSDGRPRKPCHLGSVLFAWRCGARAAVRVCVRPSRHEFAVLLRVTNIYRDGYDLRYEVKGLCARDLLRCGRLLVYVAILKQKQ